MKNMLIACPTLGKDLWFFPFFCGREGAPVVRGRRKRREASVQWTLWSHRQKNKDGMEMNER